MLYIHRDKNPVSEALAVIRYYLVEKNVLHNKYFIICKFDGENYIMSFVLNAQRTDRHLLKVGRL